MRLRLVDLENKVVSDNSNETDVLTIVLGNYEKLNGLISLIARSNEKWINLDELCEQLGAEQVMTLIVFHDFSGCDIVEKFTGKSKDTLTNRFQTVI